MPEPTSLAKATQDALQNAQTKGQVIGWIQGGGTVLVLGAALKFLGWIPVIAVAALVGFVGYKLVAAPRK